MSRYFVRSATAADNESLCALSKVPNEGRMSLALERFPDFFAGAAVQNEEVEVNICCDQRSDDRLAAVFSTGRRSLYLNNEARWVRYMSDVRILPDHRRLGPLRLVNDHVIDREKAQPSATIQSIMFADNEAMLGVVHARPPRILRRWNYLWLYPLGAYRTSAISLTTGARHHRCRHEIRRANAADIPAMQSFFDMEAPRKQFYPRYQFDRLADAYYRGLAIEDYFLAFDGDELVGITGAWDQQAYKQTRVAAYNGALRWSRPILNAVSSALSGFSLPRAGTELAYFYLHTIVIKNNSIDVFRDLVEYIHADFRNGDYLYFVCGLFTHDPLVQALDAFRSRLDVAGQHYQAGIEELTDVFSPDEPMYVEAARI